MAWADWLEAVRGGRAGPRRASHRRAPQWRRIETLEIRTLLSAPQVTGMIPVADSQTADVNTVACNQFCQDYNPAFYWRRRFDIEMRRDVHGAVHGSKGANQSPPGATGL